MILTSLPPGFLKNLPAHDKRAIAAIVGKRIALVEYDDIGRAELRFKEKDGAIHYIYVRPKFIRPAE